MSIRVFKSKEQNIGVDAQFCDFDNIVLLKFADNNFFIEYVDLSQVHQDDYLICHDIVADIFFNQLNGKNYCYTSTSSIAGHHSMSTNGTLIFVRGEPYYVWDNSDDDINEILLLEEY